MKIFHGEDIISSRRNYLSAKDVASKSGLELVDLPADTVKLAEITASLNSTSLLGQVTTVCMEGFFSRRPSNDKKSIIEYLLKNSALHVLVWEGKDVSLQLKQFSASMIIKSDLPKHIFTFLDSFSVSALRSALISSEAEVILTLLARRIADVIKFQCGLREVPAWQSVRLQALAEKFSASQLRVLTSDLINADYRQKTSTSAFPLSVELEIILSKLNHVTPHTKA